MMLCNLQPGTRFELIDSAGPLRGTLVKVNECRAVIDLDGKPTVKDFETADHEWIRLKLSGRQRMSITPQANVKVIQ
jgi:hypothetical protein